jgi:hypothetical protein
MATKNLVLDNFWVGSERADIDAWMESGSGTASYFAAEADSLLDFIAEQLPDPSPERALCRVEQLTLRATQHASASVAECAQYLASREP